LIMVCRPVFREKDQTVSVTVDLDVDDLSPRRHVQARDED